MNHVIATYKDDYDQVAQELVDCFDKSEMASLTRSQLIKALKMTLDGLETEDNF